MKIPRELPYAKNKSNRINAIATDESRLRFYIVVLLFIILVGSVGFSLSENLSAIDSLYFSIVTITTVGYGDIHPVSTIGKYMAVVLIITGGVSFLAVVGKATEMMMNKRERQIRMQKLNVVIGVFFSELGDLLIQRLTQMDPELERVRDNMLVTVNWKDRDFQKAREKIGPHRFKLTVDSKDLTQIKGYLNENRNLLLELLLNPNLLEHEAFTDLILAVSHLKEELASRTGFDELPQPDIEHLGTDMIRVYKALVQQWLNYMEHLRNDYPYLFSLAIRTNPFNDKSTVVFEK